MNNEHFTRPQELGELDFIDNRATDILNELQKQAAKCFGVTVVGPYVTLRFGKAERLVTVSMIVTNIYDSEVREELDWDEICPK